ncbi:hypothetical protein DFH08DRAFT_846743 [Mycena albidolilacea]|uniref:Uncharacterized protein n=1 Tax=Mycena albidolilacea TaxID=1033008 RepID=A0AAD7AIR8_9AGAR|nr:hypothetical protein DFH08DRAFT_846743 [Mycena albidolilacea]
MSRLILLISLATIVRAQTLLAVSPLQTTGSVTFVESATESVSALGVGADGLTTYLRVGAETLALEISGTVTKTLLQASDAILYTETFLEDASRYIAGATDSGLSQSCTFGADGEGSCVNQFVSQGPGGASTLTSTYSGPVVPWYTLPNAAAAASTPAPNGFSTSTSPSSLAASQTGTLSASGPSPTAAAPNSAASSSGWTWMAIVLPLFLHIL